MLKKIISLALALFAAAVFAAGADVNTANQAQLEAVKGIGPAIAGKILDERKKGNFKDWNDLITRVSGVGEGNAAKFSADGLTVGGASFNGVAPSAKPSKKEKAAKATDTAASAADDKAGKKAHTKAEKAADKAEAASAAKPAKADKKSKKQAADKADDAASKPAKK